MTPKENIVGRWVLIVTDDAGVEREAGRFVTDFLARQFVEDYDIGNWRLIEERSS